jgi:hypothetical protein
LEEKESDMRYKDAILSVITLALAVVTLAGMAHTDEYAHGTHAEAVGFEALAHQVFAPSKGQAK